MQIEQEEKVTREMVVAEMTSVWHDYTDVMRASVAAWTDESEPYQGVSDIERKQFLQTVAEEHSKLYAAYSHIIMHMLEGYFDTKVFDRWLCKIEQSPWRTEDEYLAAVADYASMVYLKFTKPGKVSARDAKSYKKDVLAAMKQERDLFKTSVASAELQYNAIAADLAEKNREDLKAFFRAVGDDIANAGTVRVATNS